MHQQHHDTARSVACLLGQCSLLVSRVTVIFRIVAFHVLVLFGSWTSQPGLILIRCLRKSVDESS